MAIDESIRITCFTRSGGRCECRRDHPGHPGAHSRCKATFSYVAGWTAHRVIRNAADSVVNCEVLCPACFALTAPSLEIAALRA